VFPPSARQLPAKPTPDPIKNRKSVPQGIAGDVTSAHRSGARHQGYPEHQREYQENDENDCHGGWPARHYIPWLTGSS